MFVTKNNHGVDHVKTKKKCTLKTGLISTTSEVPIGVNFTGWDF